MVSKYAQNKSLATKIIQRGKLIQNKEEVPTKLTREIELGLHKQEFSYKGLHHALNT